MSSLHKFKTIENDYSPRYASIPLKIHLVHACPYPSSVGVVEDSVSWWLLSDSWLPEEYSKLLLPQKVNKTLKMFESVISPLYLIYFYCKWFERLLPNKLICVLTYSLSLVVSTWVHFFGLINVSREEKCLIFKYSYEDLNIVGSKL